MHEQGMFGLMTMDMDIPARIRFCGFVSGILMSQAAEAADPALRENRVGEAWRYSERLTPLMTVINSRLSASKLEQITREHNQMMGLLSYAPDPWVVEQVEQDTTARADLGYLFPASIARRCDSVLDDMGIARVEGSPPADLLATATAFRWRGKTGAELFADTGLLPWSARICVERATPLTAPDFAGAPLEQRGIDGISLLDWAMECDDTEAFAALLDAGFNTDEKGQFGSPPVFIAANSNWPEFLGRLLDAGANPNVLSDSFPNVPLQAAAFKKQDGHRETWDMLRAAGASLDYANMWVHWLISRRPQEILDHWDEFGNDPVDLARWVSSDLERMSSGDNIGALEEIKRRLETQHGVCFPVGPLMELRRDDRGFYIQPDCPGEETP